MASFIAPPGRSGPFRVCNGETWFEGDVASFIDREVYLFGQYEQQSIDLFHTLVLPDRRGTILDVGANIGTHALQFAGQFERVLSFEPNPALWEQFECNMRLNGRQNVTLHRIALGAGAGELPFYAIDKANSGLGTFSTIDQYDLKLERRGTCPIETGDAYLAALKLLRIDAIKIDVQGLEPEVLAGLAGTLLADRPVVWFEYGTATRQAMGDVGDIASHFPYPITIWSVSRRKSFLMVGAELRRVEPTQVQSYGEFVVVPASD